MVGESELYEKLAKTQQHQKGTTAATTKSNKNKKQKITNKPTTAKQMSTNIRTSLEILG